MIPSEWWVILVAPLMVLSGVVIAVAALIAWESASLWRVPLGIGLAVLGGMAFAGVLREDDAGYPPQRKRRRP